MKEFYLIAGMALVTFMIRYPVLAFLNRFNLSEEQLEGLKFVPPAVLTSLIVPTLFINNGQFNLSLGNEYLLAGIGAAFIAYKYKNLLLTIFSGMMLFFLIRVLSG